MTPLERCIRAGCEARNEEDGCIYPGCNCDATPRGLLASIAAALADDEATVEAIRLTDLADYDDQILMLSDNDARAVLAALRRHILGE